ncbi:MAG: hypothetical protein ACHREM_17230 [Polyangiales bacterium]
MATHRRVAWYLNLDADLELEARTRYAPTQRVIAAMSTPRRRLAEQLAREGDVIVDESSAKGSATGCVGVAFCPTPRALERLEFVGAERRAAPSFDVLRRVNDRAFCASLGQTLASATWVERTDGAFAHLATTPTISDRWRCKRAFGMAGRGQRVVSPGALAPLDEAFVRASFASGGLQIEPDCPIETEICAHGFVDEGGRVDEGAPVAQRCDARGAWLSTDRLDDARTDDLIATLRAQLQLVGEALHRAGYFGAFGVDAFTFLRPDGSRAVQPRSEINARLSMGFAVGFGVDRLRARL